MHWAVVLFKAFWDISRDVSFNVSAKKQTNKKLIGFLPPSILSFLLLLFVSSVCFPVTWHQSPTLSSLSSVCSSPRQDAAQSSKLPFFPSLAPYCVAVHGLPSTALWNMQSTCCLSNICLSSILSGTYFTPVVRCWHAGVCWQ